MCSNFVRIYFLLKCIVLHSSYLYSCSRIIVLSKSAHMPLNNHLIFGIVEKVHDNSMWLKITIAIDNLWTGHMRWQTVQISNACLIFTYHKTRYKDFTDNILLLGLCMKTESATVPVVQWEECCVISNENTIETIVLCHNTNLMLFSEHQYQFFESILLLLKIYSIIVKEYVVPSDTI
jgi:hypothetical protein